MSPWPHFKGWECQQSKHSTMLESKGDCFIPLNKVIPLTLWECQCQFRILYLVENIFGSKLKRRG